MVWDRGHPAGLCLAGWEPSGSRRGCDWPPPGGGRLATHRGGGPRTFSDAAAREGARSEPDPEFLRGCGPTGVTVLAPIAVAGESIAPRADRWHADLQA